MSLGRERADLDRYHKKGEEKEEWGTTDLDVDATVSPLSPNVGSAILVPW